MTENRNGQVVTFYSYKGGTGRTMALANVAWILAANGKRVLVIDWDLESPGLHRFFNPFITPDALASTGGVIELIREYEWATTRQTQQVPGWVERYAHVHKYSFSLDWPNFPDGGTLDFLSAGTQNTDYAATLAGMNWDDFYEKQGGGKFFDALRADMKRHYDYTLIDSRTGLSDVADICTIHLPDVLVACFTLSEQGIEGAAQVARVVGQRYESRKIRILPVPMRIDPAEKAKADAGRLVAKQRFGDLPADLSEVERDRYWNAVQVPYQAYYAYEESLATFGDVPGQGNSLLSAYETLTRNITNGQVESLPPIEESLRTRINARFVRRPVDMEDEVTLRYAPEDQVWAEWIEHVLVQAGVRVNDPWAGGTGEGLIPARELTIVSRSNAADEAILVPPDRAGGRARLVIYVADILPLSNIPLTDSVTIAGSVASFAVERVLKLVGRAGVEVELSGSAGGPRFPGNDKTIFNVPARNARFTGRQNDLRQLRATLRTRAAVVLSGTQPVALQGMGGIGKSQLAAEYAHRFRTAYDVVWWINADPVVFVENALEDLGRELGIAMQATGPENARVVLNYLSRTDGLRWLLIFDNAEDVEKIGQFLPTAHGHVLVTSRNPVWGDRAQTMQVDVFARRESVEHLLRRVQTLGPDRANRIAELLGDLPIAIAAAAAWLADTGAPVDDYIRQIESQGPSVLRLGPASERSVEVIWDLSLSRLRERSPAAYRLLQLCSVLAPEIALDLIYSDDLAASLVRFDPKVSERVVRGSLVQAINRLALLRVDQRGEGGAAGAGGGHVLVHRVLQYVVRSRMTDDELATARAEVHKVLAAARPDGEVDDPVTWPRFRMLWPHLEVSEAVNSTDETVRRLLIDWVRYLYLQGDLVGGRERVEKVESAWVAQLATLTDPEPYASLERQVLHLRFQFANILKDSGHFNESSEVDREVLAKQRELLGDEHPHTLMTAGGLAADLRGLGRYKEALEQDIRTYATWLDAFGEDHPRTLTAWSNLAVSYRLTGDFRAARVLDEQVYQRRQIVLGDTHPNTLFSANSLGRDLRDAGEYGRSVALLESVYANCVQTRGADSRGALTVQTNLAISMRSYGLAREALQFLETAYERLYESLGPTNPETLNCRLSLSVNLLAVGSDERSARELEAVHDYYLRHLGDHHPHTFVCVNNLAMLARAQENKARARDLATSAAAGLATALGKEHPYATSAEMNLGICTAEDGDPAEAFGYLRDATARLTRVLGPDHPNTIRCRANFAMVRRTLGESEVEAELDAGLEQLSRFVGPHHPAIGALRRRRYLHRIIDPHPF